jgi:hypothetical protein
MPQGMPYLLRSVRARARSNSSRFTPGGRFKLFDQKELTNWGLLRKNFRLKVLGSVILGSVDTYLRNHLGWKLMLTNTKKEPHFFPFHIDAAVEEVVLALASKNESLKPQTFSLYY